MEKSRNGLYAHVHRDYKRESFLHALLTTYTVYIQKPNTTSCGFKLYERYVYDVWLATMSSAAPIPRVSHVQRTWGYVRMCRFGVSWDSRSTFGDPVDMQGSKCPMQPLSDGSLDGVAWRNHLQSEAQKTT